MMLSQHGPGTPRTDAAIGQEELGFRQRGGVLFQFPIEKTAPLDFPRARTRVLSPTGRAEER